jgi:type II secretory pathway component PulJ
MKSREGGLTILEVMLAVTISVIIVTALLRFLVVGFPLSRITYIQESSTETARVQLKRLTRTLRELRQADTGAYALVEAQPQRLIFYANVDNDTATERVRYELVGTNLERGIVNPTGSPPTYNLATESKTTVAASVRNGSEAIFTYYSGTYPSDTTPLSSSDVTKIKYIQFKLLVDVDPAAKPEPVTVLSQVQLRNLKTNLSE